MGKRKRYFLLLSVCLCAVLCGTQVQAKVHKGKWKSNIRWMYDTKTKELVFTGSGDMESCELHSEESASNMPGWSHFEEDVRKIVVKEGITSVAPYLGHFYNLKSLELPDSVRVIGMQAFARTKKLKKVKLPSGLKEIENDAFEDSGLTEVNIPSGVKKVRDFAFSGNFRLKKVTVEEGVEVLGFYSFSFCEDLRKLTLPKSLKKIESGCFTAAASLKKVTIPENVEQIEDDAFCAEDRKVQLRKVIIRSKKIKKWGGRIFEGARKGLVVEVPASKKEEYSKALKKKKLPSYVKSYVKVVGKKKLD